MKNLSFLAVFMLLQFAAFAQIPQDPHASFTSKSRVCSDTEFDLESTSTYSDAYEWLVNDVHYSYYPDTVISLHTLCSEYVNITLIATNNISGFTDTATKTILVTGGTCGLNLYEEYEACIGDIITYTGHPDAIQNLWTFNTPQTILAGCATCNYITYELVTLHPTLTNTRTFEGGCSDVTEYYAYFCPGSVSVNETTKQDEVSISPNPMKDKSMLHFNNAQGLKYQLSVYNMEGKLLSKKDNITGNEVTIERKDMPAGIYFYQLMSEEGKSMKGKLMME